MSGDLTDTADTVRGGARELAVTLLYVPADRKDRVAKALAGDADVVIVDLEDAVAPAAKVAARDALPDMLSGRGTRRVQVRVNAFDSPWGVDDLDAVAGLDADIDVRLPKVESGATVASARSVLGSGRGIHCLIESALGVESAYDIARHEAVASIGIGEADLRSALGVSNDEGLTWARGRVVVAANAAGLPAPVQSPYMNVRDTDGLVASSKEARGMGFVGRCAIHPSQLGPIRAAYRPDDVEVRNARETLATLGFDAGGVGDTAVGVLAGGSFVDPAMAGVAHRTLELERLTRPG